MPRHKMPSDALKKHATILEMQERKIDEASVIADKSALSKNTYPKSLVGKIARSEYKRIKPLLLEISLICDLDLTNIVGYCNAYEGYIKATEVLSEKEMIEETEDGYIINPAINIQKKYAEEMRKFESLIGMTTGSRLQAAEKKRETNVNPIQQRFGAI